MYSRVLTPSRTACSADAVVMGSRLPAGPLSPARNDHPLSVMSRLVCLVLTRAHRPKNVLSVPRRAAVAASRSPTSAAARPAAPARWRAFIHQGERLRRLRDRARRPRPRTGSTSSAGSPSAWPRRAGVDLTVVRDHRPPRRPRRTATRCSPATAPAASRRASSTSGSRSGTASSARRRRGRAASSWRCARSTCCRAILDDLERRLPGRADLQLHEPGQPRRPGGRPTTPTSRSSRCARVRSIYPRGGRRRPPASTRRGSTSRCVGLNHALAGACATATTATTSLPLAARGLGAPRRTTPTLTGEARRHAPPRRGHGRRPERLLPVLLLRATRSSPSCQAKPHHARRGHPRLGARTTGSHYAEQADAATTRSSTRRARAAASTSSSSRSTCMDAVFNDTRRDAAGQRPQRRLGARASPTRSSSRRSAAATREGIHRCRCRRCRRHLLGLVEALAYYQQAAADAAWSGDAPRRRARARRAPARPVDRPRRAPVRRDGRGPSRAPAGAARPRLSPRRRRLAGPDRVASRA